MACTTTTVCSPVSDAVDSQMLDYSANSQKLLLMSNSNKTCLTEDFQEGKSDIEKDILFAQTQKKGCAAQTPRSPDKSCLTDSDSRVETVCWTTPVHATHFTPKGSVSNMRQRRVDRLYSPGALAQGFFQHSRKLSRVADESQDVEGTVMDNSPVLACLMSLRSRLNNLKKQEAENSNNGSRDEAVELDVKKLEGTAVAPQPDIEPAAPEVVLPDVSVTLDVNVGVDKQKSDMLSEKNGHYFLQILKEEMDRLDVLASGLETELATEITLPEEAQGKLRVASCKARLLMKQKMQQFYGLCQKNICKTDDDFPTTSEDLAGFWDMVKLQINHVDQMFDEINILRKSNWVESTVDIVNHAVTAPKRRPVKLPLAHLLSNEEKAAREATRKARDELRRRIIEERRKAMKQMN